MGREATVFIAGLLMYYPIGVAEILCLGFSAPYPFALLRSATTCIHGSRSISYCSADASPEMGLALGPNHYQVISFVQH